MKRRKILALVGSTRGTKTTSESMVRYLGEKLTPFEIKTVTFRVPQVGRSEEVFRDFLNEIRDTDMLIISAPVFFDGLPYPLLQVMERLHAEEKQAFEGKELMAIIHSGYPEPEQRQVCIDNCRCFSDQVGLQWQGYLSFGATSIIAGEELTKMGRITKWMRKALDETASALGQGNPVPQSAVSLASKLSIPLPVRFMPPLLNYIMRKRIKENGVDGMARPYEQGLSS